MLAWQRGLAALGYWTGDPDGEFGLLTQQATYALEKSAGLPRDGRVDAATAGALADGVRPRPRSRAGRVVEIDLVRQLVLVVDGGTVVAILNTSTGAYGRTPRGTFRVYAQIDGLRRSPLGLLWRPKYFNRGIALHGYTSVPPWPASHGCVRLTYAAMNHVWAASLAPLGTRVLVY